MDAMVFETPGWGLVLQNAFLMEESAAAYLQITEMGLLMPYSLICFFPGRASNLDIYIGKLILKSHHSSF